MQLKRRTWFLAILVPTLVSGQNLIGPTPYLSFSDSPFTNLNFSYFFLEDWEDHTLNTPGVTMVATDPRLSSSFAHTLIDSVDADDGVINGKSDDGAGHYGDAQWARGTPGIVFSFDETVLGHLPTHVGIVWTDGAGTISFEAFGWDGRSLGVLTGNHADDKITGSTAEDSFYGVIESSGISAIHISNTTGGIEVDHLQYGAMPRLFITPQDGLMQLSWATQTNRMYQLQSSPALPATSWSDLTLSPIIGTGATNYVIDHLVRSSPKFYRLIEMPLPPDAGAR